MAVKNYILVCGGTACESSKAEEIYQALIAQAEKQGVASDVQIVKTGCFGFCEKGPIVKVLPEEAFYVTVQPEDAEEIINASAVDRRRWVQNRFDCDDFAHVLKAHFAEAAYADGKRRASHCFGTVWGMLPESHAINWMVNDDLKVRFIEPQTDKIFYPRKDDKDIWFMLV